MIELITNLILPAIFIIPVARFCYYERKKDIYGMINWAFTGILWAILRDRGIHDDRKIIKHDLHWFAKSQGGKQRERI